MLESEGKYPAVQHSATNTARFTAWRPLPIKYIDIENFTNIEI